MKITETGLLYKTKYYHCPEQFKTICITEREDGFSATLTQRNLEGDEGGQYNYAIMYKGHILRAAFGLSDADMTASELLKELEYEKERYQEEGAG